MIKVQTSQGFPARSSYDAQFPPFSLHRCTVASASMRESSIWRERVDPKIKSLNYPHMPTDYRHTNKQLRLVMTLVVLYCTNRRTSKRTDVRYQVHYLPRSAVDNEKYRTLPKICRPQDRMLKRVPFIHRSSQYMQYSVMHMEKDIQAITLLVLKTTYSNSKFDGTFSHALVFNISPFFEF